MDPPIDIHTPHIPHTHTHHTANTHHIYNTNKCNTQITHTSHITHHNTHCTVKAQKTHNAYMLIAHRTQDNTHWIYSLRTMRIPAEKTITLPVMPFKTDPQISADCYFMYNRQSTEISFIFDTSLWKQWEHSYTGNLYLYKLAVSGMTYVLYISCRKSPKALFNVLAL